MVVSRMCYRYGRARACYRSLVRKPHRTQTPPRWLWHAAVAAGILFLLGLFSTEISDPDFWWHLKTGEYIVHQNRLPASDPFSFTTADAPDAYPGESATRRFNLTHEWLAQVLLYFVYAGGFPAIVLMRACLVTAACGIAGAVAARRTNSPWWGIAAGLAAAPVLTEFATDRPGMVSFVMAMLFILILESRRGLWALPVLTVVWANCHGGFFLAWVICGVYCADALLRRAPDARRLLAISAGVILLSGANPNGFSIVPTLLRYRQSHLTSTLLEWQPAKLWGVPYTYNILLYSCAIILALAWKRVRPADWLLFGFFAYASLTALRNEPYFALVAAILIATYFPWKRELPRPLQYGGLAAMAAATAWGLASGSFFQLRAGEWRFPSGAATFLREHNISRPLFNTYFIGGYLIWKGEKVFVDGRALSEAVYKDYQTIVESTPGGPERPQLLAKYGVGAIVMDSFEYFSGTPHPLARALAYPNMADWILVYEDAQSMVFLRDPPAGIPALGKERIADHLETECRLFVEHVPRFPDCARRLGHLVMNTNPARARRAFELYFAHGGKDPEARAAYLQIR